jgi:hypothetical protein
VRAGQLAGTDRPLLFVRLPRKGSNLNEEGQSRQRLHTCAAAALQPRYRPQAFVDVFRPALGGDFSVAPIGPLALLEQVGELMSLDGLDAVAHGPGVLPTAFGTGVWVRVECCHFGSKDERMTAKYGPWWFRFHCKQRCAL